MLEGDLVDFSLPDILRLLSFTTKSGRLQVRSGAAVARIDLAEGRVRDASADATRLPLARRLLGAGLLDPDRLLGCLDDDTEQLPTDFEFARRLLAAEAVEASSLAELVREQTVDALFDVLRWEQGRFRFEGGPAHHDASSHDVVPDRSIGVDDLLDTAKGRLETWQRIRGATGPGTGVVCIVRPDADDEVGLTPDGWSLLTLVDGRRTVDDLAQLTGRGQFHTRALLETLVARGVVRVGEADDDGPVEALLAAHTALGAYEQRLRGSDDDAPVGDAAPVPVQDRPATDPVPGRHDDAEDRSEPAAQPPIPLTVRSRRRLLTDPEVDAPTVRRLMQGVEEL